MKSERSNVKFPMWRKKVDSSIFKYKATTLPNWICDVWCIPNRYNECESNKHEKSIIKIYFENNIYNGWITIAKKKRKTPAYRLWFSDELLYKIKDVYLMSYMRDIESSLRGKDHKIEEEIPFWEFLDIEYDKDKYKFYFTAYYVQKPSFPELFKRMIDSPILHKIDDELNKKNECRIHKQDWKNREDYKTEIGANNVVYTLIDTENKLIYVGEAIDLIKRFDQGHKVISHWNKYRYNILPKEFEKYRKTIERMSIRDMACLLSNPKGIDSIEFSDYRLVNEKIDI